MQVDANDAVLALLGALRPFSEALPGAEEYVMVHHPAFRVGKKPFAIVGMDEARKGATLSINLGREAQDMLLDDARFSRTPYIGQHGWVTVAWKVLRKAEWQELVRDSYRRVAGKKQLAVLDGAPSAEKARAEAPPRTPVKMPASKVRTKRASTANKGR